VRVLGKLTPDHVLVDLTKLNCSAGASARLDANPLFCKGLPRVYG
jgi:hypothetical protein